MNFLLVPYLVCQCFRYLWFGLRCIFFFFFCHFKPAVITESWNGLGWRRPSSSSHSNLSWAGTFPPSQAAPAWPWTLPGQPQLLWQSMLQDFIFCRTRLDLLLCNKCDVKLWFHWETSLSHLTSSSTAKPSGQCIWNLEYLWLQELSCLCQVVLSRDDNIIK